MTVSCMRRSSRARNFLKGSAQSSSRVGRGRSLAGKASQQPGRPCRYNADATQSIVLVVNADNNDQSSGRRRWRRGTASRRLPPGCCRGARPRHHTDAVGPSQYDAGGALNSRVEPGTPSTPAARAHRTRCPAPARRSARLPLRRASSCSKAASQQLGGRFAAERRQGRRLGRRQDDHVRRAVSGKTINATLPHRERRRR